MTRTRGHSITRPSRHKAAPSVLGGWGWLGEVHDHSGVSPSPPHAHSRRKTNDERKKFGAKVGRYYFCSMEQWDGTYSRSFDRSAKVENLDGRLYFPDVPCFRKADASRICIPYPVVPTHEALMREYTGTREMASKLAALEPKLPPPQSGTSIQWLHAHQLAAMSFRSCFTSMVNR